MDTQNGYAHAAMDLVRFGGVGVIPRTAWRWREAYRRHDAIGGGDMTTAKQQAAARRNIKKAAKAASAA
jgi:hypothetical protein